LQSERQRNESEKSTITVWMPLYLFAIIINASNAKVMGMSKEQWEKAQTLSGLINSCRMHKIFT
jgi:hypothetical protein